MWNGSMSGSDPHGATRAELLFMITTSRETKFDGITFVMIFVN